MSKKLSGSGSNSSTTLTRDERFKVMWSEIHKYVVGPMPADDFLGRFLRSETSSTSVQLNSLSNPTESLGVYVNAENEDKYKTFVTALQPICSNLEFRDTHDTPMTTFQQFTVKPDICVVDRGTGRVDMTNAEICIALKPESYHDPFGDNGERSIMKDNVLKFEKFFAKETDAGQDTFGQCTLYAAAHQAAQFRTHIFSVLVFHNHARLMRWDRSGVIVTERLSIFSPFFVEFFHLYDHATPSTRGIDISVSTPSSENESEARISLDPLPILPLIQLSLGPSSNESYIVSKRDYMNNTHSPIGRSTRTFIAYSISRKCKYFLKDSWRIGSQTPEHEIYEQLRLKNVPYIPTVIKGSDILDHTTLTSDVLEENPEWIRVPPPKWLRKHRHYRLILKEIATPLRSFPSTRVLVTAIHDAINAHRTAYFEAGILHRDISSSNIMIYNNHGLLIDWDLSKSTQNTTARELERTGTWQFMSAQLLVDQTGIHDLIDDVESFVHVITWVSFIYAKHNMEDDAVRAFLTSVFDYAWIDRNGIAKGGDAKMQYLNTPLELNRTTFENPHLKRLIKKITKIISIRYKEAPSLSGDALGDITEFAILQNNHKKRLAILENPTWMVSEFVSALSLPNWPAGDGAKDDGSTQVEKLITHTEDQSSGSKRERPENDSATGKSKKLRAMTSGSGKGK